MESGDGLISRVRLPAGYLSADQLSRVATLSEQDGLGLLELTSRGNLQIRGLTETSESHLTRELVAAGLALTDPEAEACRNIQSSPGADLDAMAIANTRPMAERLDARLQAEPDFRKLPPKFRFVLNGGGRGHLADVDGDIRADAVTTTAGGVGFRLALAGTAQSARSLGLCRPEGLIDALAELAHGFLALNGRLLTPMRRMSGLLDIHGEAPFLDAIGTGLQEAPELPAYPVPMKPGPLGSGIVAGIPFGRLDAAQAHALSEISQEEGEGEIRTTPWRQVLIPGNPGRLGPRLRGLGLIMDPTDPRNSVVACPGHPECRSGTTGTRQDALAWAQAVPDLFDGESIVHVSGCGKGCARPGQSPITIVAHEGLYDIILNDKALPEDEASRIVRGLDPAEVPGALRALGSRAR